MTAAGAAAGGVGVTGLAGDFAAATTTEPITALTSIITARPTALFPARVKRTSMFPPGRWVVTSSPVQPCVNHPRKPAPTPLPYQQFTDTGRFASARRTITEDPGRDQSRVSIVHTRSFLPSVAALRATSLFVPPYGGRRQRRV
ncbi:hypothetical protein GCM10009630_43280 [Kribbella jejuensis]